MKTDDEIKLIWNGNFSGTEYSIKINRNTHHLLHSSDLKYTYEEDLEYKARKEAFQWLIAYGYSLKDFDVYKEPFLFGGSL